MTDTTLQERLRDQQTKNMSPIFNEAADALDAHDATIAEMVEALGRIVIASDYYGKEASGHDELTLAYAHQSTCNLARAALNRLASRVEKESE